MAGMETHAGFSLTQEERVALTFIAHNDPRDGFVRRTWLEFKTAICGLLQRTRGSGWIPVSERLPEGSCRVLAWDGTRVSEVHFHPRAKQSEQWYSFAGHESPTHWMPLPEPPEVK